MYYPTSFMFLIMEELLNRNNYFKLVGNKSKLKNSVFLQRKWQHK